MAAIEQSDPHPVLNTNSTASLRRPLSIAGLLVLGYQAIVLALHLDCISLLVRAAPGVVTLLVAAVLMLYVGAGRELPACISPRRDGGVVIVHRSDLSRQRFAIAA